MPILPTVGRRSWGLRSLLLAMYSLLALGAVSMVVPFLLMLSLSVAGRDAARDIRLVPADWRGNAGLFRRYLLDALPYGALGGMAADYPVHVLRPWLGRDDLLSSRDLRAEDLLPVLRYPAAARARAAADLRLFLDRACPGEFKIPAFLFERASPLALLPEYHAWLKQTYGSLAAVNRVYGDTAATWDELGVPYEPLHRYPDPTPRNRDWRRFLETRAPERTGLLDADEWALAVLDGLPPPAAGGRRARAQWTADDLLAGTVGREARERLLRVAAPARFVRLDPALARNAWQTFLAARREDTAAPLDARLPRDPRQAAIWSTFVQTECPLESLDLVRPEPAWRAFLAARYGADVAALNRAHGTAYAAVDAVRLPRLLLACDNFLRLPPGLRWRYLWHNYREVLGFIALHGNAARVTLVYIVLALAGTLTVTPLAAYALSRFRLKETQAVLLFLLATMAFPGEVLMIPSFLLIKTFPVGAIAALLLGLLLFYGLYQWLGRRWAAPPALRAAVALAVVALLAGWGLPRLARAVHAPLSVSLMNTYWALVLPGLASGYGVFLLKGFFDSLPPELYEAALLDGAGEWRMFWRITLPLCKPILAVMMLGAFTGAYGAFMHAFLICQDPRMWTIMVFLYEFQQQSSLPLVMAALVVAAIPTLTVFLLCQNIILRGIILPAFK